jgi:hypothetical protein
MLENKIAEKLKDHQLDPQSPDLFASIMQKRSQQNSKPMLWVMGTIAIMFAGIAVFSGSEHWGKLPADGKTKEQVIALKAREKAVYDSICAVHDAIRAAEKQKAIADSEAPKTKKGAIIQESNEDNINTDIAQTAISTETGRSASVKMIEDNKSKSTINIAPKSLTLYQRRSDIEKNNIWTPFASSMRSIKPLHSLELVDNSSKQVIASDKPDEANDDKKAKNSVFKFLIPRELDVYAGAYAQNRFANDNNPLGSRINSQIKINNTQQLGFTAEYNLKRSVFAQIGVQWLGFSQSILPYNYNEKRTWQETIVDPGGQTKTVTRTETSNQYVGGGKSYHQFIEIPLSVGARFTLNKRHLIQPQFGIVGSFYNQSTGLAFNTNGTDVEQINGKVNRWNNAQASIISGVSYTYIIGERYGLFIHPNLRYSLNSQSKNSLQIDELNYMFGAQIGMKYILK